MRPRRRDRGSCRRSDASYRGLGAGAELAPVLLGKEGPSGQAAWSDPPPGCLTTGSRLFPCVAYHIGRVQGSFERAKPSLTWMSFVPCVFSWLFQAMESLPQVEAGVVGLHKSSRLVAFVVPTIQPRRTEDSRVSSRALEKEVLKGLSQLVPRHGIPDTVLLVPGLPLTNHGTVCFFSPLCLRPKAY